jgi:hypothetical protein
MLGHRQDRGVSALRHLTDVLDDGLQQDYTAIVRAVIQLA